MSEVRLEHLTKTFAGKTVAVDDVNLMIDDGEFLVLVGPSGCGKSTVLRMIAGLEDVTAGRVFIDGRDVTDLPPKGRDIAMVFQNYALYPHMSVAGNMAFALKLRGKPKDETERQVNETARLLGLHDLLERRPAALSGGQRQRVAMGRALVRQPQVFLMDEPLSNLDARLRVTMRGELTRLHQRYGITTVYVTHDQVEAMTLGDRIAVLDRGRLQQVGTPEQLYRSPANRFVAGFMGSPSMNFTTARVRTGGPPVVEVAGRSWPLPGGSGRWSGLHPYADRDVVLGLRPSAFALADPADDPAAVLSVVLAGVESLGDEKHLLFGTPGADPADDLAAIDDSEAPQLWTAKVPARADLAIGHTVLLRPDLDQAYFFDPDTGLAIGGRPSDVRTGAADERHLATVAG